MLHSMGAAGAVLQEAIRRTCTGQQQERQQQRQQQRPGTEQSGWDGAREDEVQGKDAGEHAVHMRVSRCALLRCRATLPALKGQMVNGSSCLGMPLWTASVAPAVHTCPDVARLAVCWMETVSRWCSNATCGVPCNAFNSQFAVCLTLRFCARRACIDHSSIGTALVVHYILLAPIITMTVAFNCFRSGARGAVGRSPAAAPVVNGLSVGQRRGDCTG